MNFLFPLYLAGALAIAVPIYLHLRRKPPKDAVDFSSLMFLEPTKHQPLKRKSQLENLPLLIARCLALLLLAAMFSRPFLKGGDSAAGDARARTVVLIDTSASMRRSGLMPQAIAASRDIIDDIPKEGSLAILTIDSAPRTLIGFEDWRDTEPARRASIAREAVTDLAAGWGSSDLGSGLTAAAEFIADASAEDEQNRAAKIILISDLQSGAALDALSDATWPGGVNVTVQALEAEASTNASLHAAASSDATKIAVRVRNDPASEKSQFQLRAGEATLSAVVPAGESRRFEFDAGATEVTLSGDAHDFDNRLSLAPREPAPVDLLFLGREQASDSNGLAYYFHNAFALSQVLRPKVVESLADAPAIIGVGQSLTEADARQLRSQLEAGGQALMVLENTAMADTLAQVAGLERRPALSEDEAEYSLLQRIDFEHPALAAFKDPRWRDFTGVHFWHHRTLDIAELPPTTQVLAEFDNGDPAWLQIPVGKGTLLVMTAGWHPRDSQLALSSKFLPLLFSIFADQGSRVGEARQFFVGETLPLTEREQRITGPDGKTVERAQQEPFRPDQPGIYSVQSGPVKRQFAVNLRPSESELSPLGDAPLAALGVPLTGSETANAENSAEAARQMRGHESEAQQNLWRWVVLGLLALLILESLLARRSRGPAAIVPTESAPS